MEMGDVIRERLEEYILGRIFIEYLLNNKCF